MNTQRETDLATLEERRFLLQRYPQPDGWLFLVVEGYPLPAGYNRERTRLLIKIPPLYPLAQLDMFWMDPDLRLQNGTLPANTCQESLIGTTWLRFSWHPTAWRPGRDTLLTFLGFIERRLCLVR